MSPIQGSLRDLQLDLGVLLGFTFVAVVLMRGARNVSRLEGGLLTGCYMGFLAVL